MKRVALAVLATAFASACFNFESSRAACIQRGDCIDENGPKLIATSPARGATDVRVDSTIGLTFSQAMSPGSVQMVLAPVAPLNDGQWDPDNVTATFQPIAKLAQATTYTVTVTGKSTENKSLTDTFTFTTETAPDTTPPTITSSFPPYNSMATQIQLDAHLTVTFSEPMAKDSFTVSSSPTFNFGEPTWSSGDKTVTFSMPAENLKAETTYYVTVDGRDKADNSLGATTFSFTTIKAPDTTPPDVIATQPYSTTPAVSPNVQPSVTFSEAVKPGVTAAMSISPAPPGPCTWVLDSTATLVTCQHNVAFAVSTTYTISASTAVQDLAGNSMAMTRTFQFATTAAPDTTAPTLVSSNPANGSKGLSFSAPVSLTFSEQMDKGTVQGAFKVFSASAPVGGGPGPAVEKAGTFSWDVDGGTAMHWTPLTPWTYDQLITWQLSPAAKDLAGNPLANNATGSFNTIRFKYMTVYANGADGGVGAQSGYLRSQTSGVTFDPSYTVMWTGDNDPPKWTYRSLIYFDLSVVPAGATFTSATLNVYQTSVYGSPFTELGNVVVERISPPSSVASFSATALDGPGRGGKGCIGPFPVHGNCDALTLSSDATSPSTKTLDVKYWIDAAYPSRKLLFRVRHASKDSNGDSAADYVSFASGSATTGRPYLNLAFEYP